MSYSQQNARVLLEVEALAEKIGYGQLDISFDLHNRRITATTFRGTKRNKYTKNNQQAMQDIAERLTKSITDKRTEVITFNVHVRSGNIEQTLWQSQQKRSHEG